MLNELQTLCDIKHNALLKVEKETETYKELYAYGAYRIALDVIGLYKGGFTLLDIIKGLDFMTANFRAKHGAVYEGALNTIQEIKFILRDYL